MPVSSTLETGTIPLGQEMGTIPLGHETGTIPLGHETGTIPLGHETGTIPLGHETGTIPLGHRGGEGTKEMTTVRVNQNQHSTCGSNTRGAFSLTTRCLTVV